MFKRILLFLIVMSFAASLAGPVFAAQTPGDISGHWAQSKIELAISMGLFSGDPHLLERFEPDRPMTRAELCGVLNRLHNFTEEADIAFSDVSAASPYAVELKRAVKAGYFFGDDRGRANPVGLLTRSEAAAMIYRIEKYPLAAGESKRFRDHRDIPSWAVDAVDACVKKGVIKGDDENRFRPNDNLTRAEVVALIYNLIFV